MNSMRSGHGTSIVTAQLAKFYLLPKNSKKCVGMAKWKPFSSPLIVSLDLVGVLGKRPALFERGKNENRGLFIVTIKTVPTSYMPLS